MPIATYHLLDVFTDAPFAGNQLAVFVDPPELTTETMQAIARELNYSESVFVRSPGADDEAWPTRIFTPGEELPFAGHPTVGTGVLLRHLGLAGDEVVLAERVGPVPLALRDGWARFRSARVPDRVETADPEWLVRALGLTLRDLHPELSPGGWSAGVPFAAIPLRDVTLLERATVDLTIWRDEVQHRGADQLYPIAPLDGLRGGEWRGSAFAPGFGIPEDPATGSAAAAVAGLLASAADDRRLRDGWTIHQGVEMGRPSRIELSVDVTAGELRSVHVAGHAVVVGDGRIFV